MYKLWGEFELNGYTFKAYIPTCYQTFSELGWKIDVYRQGHIERIEYVKMTYEPRFGPDVSDKAALDDRVEQIIEEMGLEDDGRGKEEEEKEG